MSNLLGKGLLVFSIALYINNILPIIRSLVKTDPHFEVGARIVNIF